MSKILLVFTILLISFPANAQNKSPYEVIPEVEIPLSVGTFAVLGLPRLLVSEFLRVPCEPDCNPKDVNAFDRTAIGYHSQRASSVSDAAFATGIVMPHAFGALDQVISDSEDGWEGYGKDSLVLIETLVFTLAINNMVDLLVRRPRPLVYDTEHFTDAERLNADSASSFPSGHTSVPFAMATAYSRLYMMRHPDSPFVIPMWIGTHSIGVAAGLGRVFAGEHFWSDVIVGAILGSGMGLLVPWLHEQGEDPSTAWKVIPQFHDEGGGLSFHQRF